MIKMAYCPYIYQPSGQYNTALGIEDAQTLGSLFAGIQHRDQIPILIAAYEELRQSHCEFTKDWERRKRDMLTLPVGRAQVERDLFMRKSHAYTEWESMDEQAARAIWGAEIELFAYDANEIVEDWWTKWGGLLVRTSQNGEGQPLSPSLQVSISKVG
jgi:salicylate hydroxylase